MKLEDRFYEDLLSAGILYISGEIDGKTLERVNQAMAWLEATGKDGVFYFNSHGGCAAVALDCYDRIRTSTARVTGIVAGRAFSSAAVILLACHVRKMQQSGEILIHKFRPEKDNVSQEFVAREVVRSNALLRRILIDRTNLSLAEIEDLCEQAAVIAADRALEMTLVDEVITSIP